MDSDGDRKTLSELQREIEATRAKIAEEAQQLELVTRAMAKTQFSIDQLFRFFAHEIKTEEEKTMLVDIFESNYVDLHIENIPLIPISTAIATGRLSNARRIYAADSSFVDDTSATYFAHVLRFAPQATQIDFVDISGTAVTEKGIFFILEAVVERECIFTLVAKRLSVQIGIGDGLYHSKCVALLKLIARGKHTVILGDG